MVKMNFGKKINIFFESLKITLKELFEFKANLYSTLIVQLPYYFAFGTFTYIFFKNFADVVGWSLGDILIFIGCTSIIHLFTGLFFWGKRLGNMLPRGDLNLFLIRPISPIYLFILRTLNYSVMLFMFFNCLLLIGFLFYLEIVPDLFFIFIFVLLCVLSGLSGLLIDSLEFYMLGLGNIIFKFYDTAAVTTKNFPGDLFKDLKFSFVFLLFQGYYVSIVLVPYLRGVPAFNFIYETIVLISLVIILFSLLIFNWKRGLKTYEAYG